MDTAIEKVSIIVSKGSLEGIYPALIMANGARAEGIEANLFFTFSGVRAHKRFGLEPMRPGGAAPGPREFPDPPPRGRGERSTGKG